MVERKPILNLYGYIYLITNNANGRKYIGQHAHSLPEIDYSYLGSGKLLKKAINKYGEENFSIDILDWAENKQELDELERLYISMYNAVKSDEYYNLSDGGEGHSSEEAKRFITEETRRKISESRTGAKHSDATKRKMAVHMMGDKNPNYGKKLSQSQRERISIAQKNKVVSNETKQKMRESKLGINNPNYGRKHTDEEKSLLSNRMSGKNNPNYGNKWNEEQRKRASEKHKGHPGMVGKDNPMYGDHRFSGKNHPLARKLKQIDENGNTVRVYDYVTQVEKFGYNKSCVIDCCRGRKNQYRGYKWRYCEEDGKE